MRPSIRLRLPLTYILVIALASLGSALLVKPALWQYFVRERQAELLLQGSNIAAAARLEMLVAGRGLFHLVRAESERLSARVLLIDTNSQVIVDAHGTMAGTTLATPELKKSLGGQSEAVVRRSAAEPMLYVFVPIASETITDGRPQDVLGVVLLINSLANLEEKQQIIARRLLGGSLIAALFAVPMAIYFALGISTPIVSLTAGAEQMAAGALGTTVKPSGDKEVYALGEAFNSMSLRLAALEEVRRKFIADASHELRTPLASMKALLAPLVGEEPVDPIIVRDFLGNVDSELERLSRLVDDLLKLARLDSRPELEKSRFDLAQLVVRVVNSLTPLAEKKGIEVFLGVMPPTMVEADEDKLHSALLNIVDNAVKFAHTTVYLNLYVDEKIRVSIADDGPGIPAKAVGRLFERFFRVDEARARNTGGSGLGLAIAWEIIDLHSGTISVESALGQGTTVTVILS